MKDKIMSNWFWYAVGAAVLYGAHQIFTKMASDKIGDGLGGFVVEGSAALTILGYLAALKRVLESILERVPVKPLIATVLVFSKNVDESRHNLDATVAQWIAHAFHDLGDGNGAVTVENDWIPSAPHCRITFRSTCAMSAPLRSKMPVPEQCSIRLSSSRGLYQALTANPAPAPSTTLPAMTVWPSFSTVSAVPGMPTKRLPRTRT